MKNLKSIIFIVLAVVLIAGAFAFAETARLGKTYAPSFSPTAQVTKTAAYTLTSSDSYVKFTASSANIVATLPKISSLSGVSISYKIEKTDATAYAIVVTPASGDTIGGESTRYLIGDDAYMIIKSGSGSNWEITYESPYIVENHEAGTYTTGIGSGGLVSAKTTSVTLTGSDCGNVITAGTGTLTFTLPPTVANCKFTFINLVATAEMNIDPDAADNIYGGVTLASSVVTIDDTAGDVLTNTVGTSIKGDFITLVGDGSVGWYIIGSQGIWAEK